MSKAEEKLEEVSPSTSSYFVQETSPSTSSYFVQTETSLRKLDMPPLLELIIGRFQPIGMNIIKNCDPVTMKNLFEAFPELKEPSSRINYAACYQYAKDNVDITGMVKNYIHSIIDYHTSQLAVDRFPCNEDILSRIHVPPTHPMTSDERRVWYCTTIDRKLDEMRDFRQKIFESDSQLKDLETMFDSVIREAKKKVSDGTVRCNLRDIVKEKPPYLCTTMHFAIDYTYPLWSDPRYDDDNWEKSSFVIVLHIVHKGEKSKVIKSPII